MTEDLWMADYERACDEFAADQDAEAFAAKLKALGFDPDEIEDEIIAGMEDNGEVL